MARLQMLKSIYLIKEERDTYAHISISLILMFFPHTTHLTYVLSASVTASYKSNNKSAMTKSAITTSHSLIY